MKSLLTTLALTSAIVMPGSVMAKTITLTTEMAHYRGPEAYLVIYITDAKGVYQDTIWVSGRKSKYYGHLVSWYRATGASAAEINGITGASVGSGRTMTVSFDLSDALFDAGYQLRIDTSVEDGRDVAHDVVVPLISDKLGKDISGRRYIKRFTFR